MKLFLDTNVLIDLVANRKPWVESVLMIFELANQHKVNLVAADYSFINIVYICRKIVPMDVLYKTLIDVQEFVDVAYIGHDILNKSLNSQWRDFEDCIQCLVAEREHADFVITRNTKDFQKASIPALSPSDFLDYYFSHSSNATFGVP